GGGSALGSPVQQSPGPLWVTPGGTAELSCHLRAHETRVQWYKETADGSLDWIYWSSNRSCPKGKYSGKEEKPGSFSLTISPAEREDSGVYYCSPPTFHPSFGNGTRLVVTSECPAVGGHPPWGAWGGSCPPPSTPFPSPDATQPQLSILLPVDEEEKAGGPPGRIPLLCQLRDLPPGWDRVLWRPGDGEVTGVTAVAVDQQGVLSGWSITWVPAERW
ncbi:KV6A9 protein, partial [Arenaria interpres]|nr:KV6A9 protein [Arenaria interpres]